MKKSLKKFTKILVLIAMIFSDLMTPISVLADQIFNELMGEEVDPRKKFIEENANYAELDI